MNETESYIISKNVETIKSATLSKFPTLGTAMSTLRFLPNNSIRTARTNGKVVYYNEKFFASLSYEEKIFLFAHEVMHVALKHIPRRNGKKRKLWNTATDAVINQILKAENLPMIEGVVDMPFALDKSADEVYTILAQKQKQQPKKKINTLPPQSYEQGDGNTGEPEDDFEPDSDSTPESDSSSADDSNPNSSNNPNEENSHDSYTSRGGEPENDDIDDDEDSDIVGHADHDLWDEAEKTAESEGQDEVPDNIEDIEKNFRRKNKETKNQKAQEIIDKLKREKANTTKADKSKSSRREIIFGAVGDDKPAVSWQRLLIREWEKEQEQYSYRKASKYNNYQPRIQLHIDIDMPSTEVLLDTSGSVDNELIKAFLRQLKPLLRESRLMVGCFDTQFYGFTEIKKKSDIDSFVIQGRGGTDFDLALNSFSNDPRTNKIIFTDGEDSVSDTPENRKKKVIWLLWKMIDFHPCCGKVIYVDKNTLHLSFENENPEEETPTNE